MLRSQCYQKGNICSVCALSVSSYLIKLKPCVVTTYTKDWNLCWVWHDCQCAQNVFVCVWLVIGCVKRRLFLLFHTAVEFSSGLFFQRHLQIFQALYDDNLYWAFHFCASDLDQISGSQQHYKDENKNCIFLITNFTRSSPISNLYAFVAYGLIHKHPALANFIRVINW